MKNNSDTPRTDHQAYGSRVMAHEMVHADFARKLERETYELKLQLLNLIRDLATEKDSDRLDWLLHNAIIQYNPTWHPMDSCRIETIEDVDEAMKLEDMGPKWGQIENN